MPNRSLLYAACLLVLTAHPLCADDGSDGLVSAALPNVRDSIAENRSARAVEALGAAPK